MIVADKTYTRKARAQAAAHAAPRRTSERIEPQMTYASRDDRLRALGQSQAALAHQLRNPLTVAGLSIDHLLSTTEAGDVRERLERVRGSLTAIELQIRNALVFVKGELPEYNEFSVAQLVCDMRQAWELLLCGRAVTWHVQHASNDRVLGDCATLLGALTNLIDNALAVGGATVALDITVTTTARCLVIRVADNGPGMSAQVLAHACEPFVSHRAGGTGLGLAIVAAVVKAHRGVLHLDSAPGAGTRVSIELPLCAEAAQ
jgi:two-component system sensor histidine kinase FlrB